MTGHPSNRRCPKCGAALFTDGRVFWCSQPESGCVFGLYEADRGDGYTETRLDRFQPGKVPPPKPAGVLLTCEAGHQQTVWFRTLDADTVDAITRAKLNFGACAVCTKRITAQVVEE